MVSVFYQGIICPVALSWLVAQHLLKRDSQSVTWKEISDTRRCIQLPHLAIHLHPLAIVKEILY